MRKLWPLLILCLVSCCGYSTRSLLPSYLKTIYIPAIQNRTLKPLLSEKLNDELVTAFTRSGRLRVSSDPSADIVLNIQITGYRKSAAVYDTSRSATEWRYEISYSGEGTDQLKKAKLWGGSSNVGNNYDVSLSEDEVIDRLVKSVADEIVQNILTAW